MCVTGLQESTGCPVRAGINRRYTVRWEGFFVGLCAKLCEHGDRYCKVTLSHKRVDRCLC
jgi:hypothetical protein